MGLVSIGLMWMSHRVCLFAIAGLCVAVWTLHRQRGLQAAERWRERHMREELEAYARVDPSRMGEEGNISDSAEAGRSLARRVCRTVAEKSVFSRVTMLLRSPEGRFACVGSVGVDDLTVTALTAWGEKIVAEERVHGVARSVHAGVKSFSIPLGEWSEFDREVGSWALSGKRERRRWRRALVAPICTGNGKMAGALVVCADGTSLEAGIEQAMSPIEALAARISRELENESLRERLLRAEKLAALGEFAGGVAQALNNPLTAVLGFAELIAETSEEPRVRSDAAAIVLEAHRMKETVDKLVEFGRPVPAADGVVSLSDVLRQLSQACVQSLRERGVSMVLSVPEEVPTLRGSRERLCEMLEHLLTNAAQAIATARPREEGEEHAIRLTLSHDDRTLYLIVSDTGPGFREPTRIFDPFYTTRNLEGGAGLGLSVCYGIVREHGGEISAVNLYPHGAAVVVELPIGPQADASVAVRKPVPSQERSNA